MWYWEVLLRCVGVCVVVQEAEATEAECRGELEDLEAQILDLDAQLCSQHPPPGAANTFF